MYQNVAVSPFSTDVKEQYLEGRFNVCH